MRHDNILRRLLLRAATLVRVNARRDRAGSDASAALNLADHVDRQITRLDLLTAVLESKSKQLDQISADASTALNLANHGDRQITRLDTAMAILERKMKQLEGGGQYFGFLRQGQLFSAAPDLVFVCSRGRTGTWWLTEALNMHDDVLAAHGWGAPPHAFPGKKNARPEVDSDQTSIRRVSGLRLSESLDDIRRVDQARFYCYVHAITLHDLAERLNADLAGLRIGAINVVRHPITRINSFSRLFCEPHELETQDHLLERWHGEEIFARYRERISAAYPIDFAIRENIFFAMACHWLIYDQEDFQYPVRHFSFEKLVADRASFASMLHSAFGPTLKISDQYLDQVFQLGRRNTRTEKIEHPNDVYASWLPWQRHCFKVVFEGIDLTSMYKDFDYDFSFL